MKKLLFMILCIIFFIGCSNTRIDRRERISKYFIMEEAIRSDVAKKYRISNIPNKEEIQNIKYTARRMDEVRKLLKRQIIVTSWFRGEKLNKKVGGARTSAHRNGLAVDFVLKNGNFGWKEYELLKKKMSSYDQLIYYPRRGHIHIGFRTKRSSERRENMIKR